MGLGGGGAEEGEEKRRRSGRRWGTNTVQRPREVTLLRSPAQPSLLEYIVDQAAAHMSGPQDGAASTCPSSTVGWCEGPHCITFITPSH
jgi:hypothetical protein